MVATIAIIAPIITAMTKAAIGPAKIAFFPKNPLKKLVVVKLNPANAEITPTERDIYPIDGTPVPNP